MVVDIFEAISIAKDFVGDSNDNIAYISSAQYVHKRSGDNSDYWAIAFDLKAVHLLPNTAVVLVCATTGTATFMTML